MSTKFKANNQLLHNSLGKKCPAAFWHHLRQLTIPTDTFSIKTASIYISALSQKNLKFPSMVILGGHYKALRSFSNLPEHSQLR